MLLGYVVIWIIFLFCRVDLVVLGYSNFFVVLLFGADMAANAFGVKKFGGTKAGVWGSTIGLIFGPFVIPVAGILIGPFLGQLLRN